MGHKHEGLDIDRNEGVARPEIQCETRPTLETKLMGREVAMPQYKSVEEHLDGIHKNVKTAAKHAHTGLRVGLKIAAGLTCVVAAWYLLPFIGIAFFPALASVGTTIGTMSATVKGIAVLATTVGVVLSGIAALRKVGKFIKY